MVNPENEIPENLEDENEDPRSPFEEFLYHQRRALEETGRALESLLPDGFRKHGRQASQEFTKSFRVLVDAAMTEIKKGKNSDEDDDESADDNGPSTTGKTKVKVQVD